MANSENEMAIPTDDNVAYRASRVKGRYVDTQPVTQKKSAKNVIPSSHNVAYRACRERSVGPQPVAQHESPEYAVPFYHHET